MCVGRQNNDHSMRRVAGSPLPCLEIVASRLEPWPRQKRGWRGNKFNPILSPHVRPQGLELDHGTTGAGRNKRPDGSSKMLKSVYIWMSTCRTAYLHAQLARAHRISDVRSAAHLRTEHARVVTPTLSLLNGSQRSELGSARSVGPPRSSTMRDNIEATLFAFASLRFAADERRRRASACSRAQRQASRGRACVLDELAVMFHAALVLPEAGP